MMKKLIRHAAVIVVLLQVVLVQSALSCPVCYTDPNSPTSNAVAYAIVALLGVTGTVLGAFASLFVYLRRRAKKMTLKDRVDFPSVN